MIVTWGMPHPRMPLARILVNGCGVGMYVRALQPYAQEVYGIDIEPEHLSRAAANAPGAKLQLAMCEALPYADATFDLVLSHEVIEHVADDRKTAAEITRVLRPGGRAVIFAPNRWYPFETHGHYWRGQYHFGNTPLINYLPDSLRNQLAPHVRTYSAETLRRLFVGLPVRVVHYSRIFPGYDNIAYRSPALGKTMRCATYALEGTPARALGISHVLAVEKVA